MHRSIAGVREGGIYEEVTGRAIKHVFARQVEPAMKEREREVSFSCPGHQDANVAER